MPHARGTLEVRYDAAGRTSGAGAFVRERNIYGYYWRQTWGESYVYGPDGRRVYKKDVETGEERYYLWVGGELLAEYRPARDANGAFAGWEQVNAPDPYRTYKDRLGSNVYQQKYYPYGEAQQTASTYTYATYSRDVGTGLDYAQQRYYSSTVGRFTTPDPYAGSARLTNPSSWNRYSYVHNDPVNFNDPAGAVPMWAACGSLEFLKINSDGPGGILTVNVWCETDVSLTAHLLQRWSWAHPESLGGGGGASGRERLKLAWQRVRGAIHAAAAMNDAFTASLLDCMAGMESAFNADSNRDNSRSHKGLFQFDASAWQAAGMGVAFDPHVYDAEYASSPW